MAKIKCNNANDIAVEFILNGGRADQITVFAEHDNVYWFSIGKLYKTINGAKKAAVKAMSRFGYTFDEQELKSLTIA